MLNIRRALMTAAVASAVVILGGCRGAATGENTPEPTPTGTVTMTAPPEPTPTATVSIEDEVAEAYLAHWVAYSDAVLYLDISFVEGYASGEELEAVRAEIESLRSDGVALRVVVEHDFLVASASGSAAVVLDRLVNNSFYVDARTREPETGAGAGDVIRQTTYMEKIDGRWVVTRVTKDRSD